MILFGLGFAVALIGATADPTQKRWAVILFWIGITVMIIGSLTWTEGQASGALGSGLVPPA